MGKKAKWETARSRAVGGACASVAGKNGYSVRMAEGYLFED
jgi:hypothetical protein